MQTRIQGTTMPVLEVDLDGPRLDAHPDAAMGEEERGKNTEHHQKTTEPDDPHARIFGNLQPGVHPLITFLVLQYRPFAMMFCMFDIQFGMVRIHNEPLRFAVGRMNFHIGGRTGKTG